LLQRLSLVEIRRKTILLLVTGVWTGYLPVMPGTFGTLLAIPLSLALNRLALFSLPLASITLVGFIASSIWLSGKGAAILGQKDPSVIVIDEVCGFMVANFLVPLGAMSLFLAFFLFRLFDITKIYPASKLEKLSGASGIVLDDVMAGLYTLIIMQLLNWWEFI
jgi:phosphatidylglycerophosphatase A